MTASTIEATTRFPRENVLDRTYRVAITYCDSINAIHTHVERETAVDEYAGMVAEAIEPTSTHPDARHIRVVTLIVSDDTGKVVAQVHSGVIPCADHS